MSASWLRPATCNEAHRLKRSAMTWADEIPEMMTGPGKAPAFASLLQTANPMPPVAPVTRIVLAIPCIPASVSAKQFNHQHALYPAVPSGCAAEPSWPTSRRRLWIVASRGHPRNTEQTLLIRVSCHSLIARLYIQARANTRCQIGADASERGAHFPLFRGACFKRRHNSEATATQASTVTTTTRSIDEGEYP